jgi:hypothetical protein
MHELGRSLRYSSIRSGYARNQVRLTGINWFDEQGILGPSDKNLDVILRCLRYTVHPPRSVRLLRGSVQPKDGEFTTVMQTDCAKFVGPLSWYTCETNKGE